MASMAAAIAAARVATSGNRPLDEKERNRFAYFSSLNSMAKKIMQDKERIRERYGAQWEKMQPKEQDEAIDQNFVDPELQKRYTLHRGPAEPQPVSCYPVLKTQTGQKVVHFREESQMEFSISSLPAQDSTSCPAQSEQKQTPKSFNQSNQSKTNLVSAPTKPTAGTRATSCESSTPVRKEEESAFWKISMERSRVEGSQSEFQSLTPSQIKSLEKGEKPLPVYNRQDSFQKEKEVLAKPDKPEKPAAVPEKPAVVTKQPKTVNPGIVSPPLKNSRPSQSSVSTVDDVFLPEPPAPVQPVQPVTKTSLEPGNEEALSTGPQLFSQINTSSVLLKTGFDFLDNW
ncbi:uncharacterized protein C1orf198 homolog isoform X3 [Pseudophryne corroboree]|uniref:uncharacterized protein C1orf198 homolog isoform X3 n=1 Tax=Pseudophryne corroboree TaxID=495146 RepID=UPI003081221A